MPKGRTIHVQQTLVESAARTTSSNSNPLRVDFTEELMFQFAVTAASGTNEGMGLSIQWSFDQTNWFTSHEIVRATGTGKLVKRVETLAKYVRVAWALTGTSPSFTFAALIAWRE